jgi:hypothetical protein
MIAAQERVERQRFRQRAGPEHRGIACLRELRKQPDLTGCGRMPFCFIPNGAKNLPRPQGQGKEGFLTSQTPFGMTRFEFFGKFVKADRTADDALRIVALKGSAVGC